MEKIIKTGSVVNFKEIEYNNYSVQKLDDNTIHLITDDVVFCFIVNDTELNEVVYNNSDELINALNGI